MPTTYTAKFDISSWEEETFDEASGARLFLIRVGKDFWGEVSGTSTTTLAAAVSDASDTDAGYGGVERLDVSVAGVGEGTLVLRHAALSSAEGAAMDVVVVPGTGTGDLAGATGTAHVDRHDDGSHTFTLTLD